MDDGRRLQRTTPPRVARASWPWLLLAIGVVSACGAGGQRSTPPALPSPEPPSATSAAPSSESPTLSPGPPVWSLVWSDEFDGPAGTPPDPSIWGRDLGDGTGIGNAGWGNQEKEYYTDGAENAATDGQGNLVITARQADGAQACYYGPCEYTSARLLTRDRHEIHYGKVEARIKVPGGVGLWPAFWMLGTDIEEVGWPAAGEIDVMEFVGRWPTYVLGTIHGPGYYGSSGFSKTLDLGVPVADDFHRYAIEWRPGHIAWFLDGAQYHEASAADVAPGQWVFDHPFFLLLNLAVGGTLGGPVFPDTTFPQSMAIDYVRVYRDVAP